MKRCRYCGREDEESASRCRECGTDFIDSSRPGILSDDIAALKLWGPKFVANLNLKRQWPYLALGLSLILALAYIAFRPPPALVSPRVTVLAAWNSNNERYVTIRLDPTNAEVMYMDLVSPSYNASMQPQLYNDPDMLIPYHDNAATNYSLRHVATPRARSFFNGKPLAFTPGSYTVAYTPSPEVNRIRVGVARQEKGLADYLHRLRRACAHKQWSEFYGLSHQPSVFITIDPQTNSAPNR